MPTRLIFAHEHTSAFHNYDRLKSPNIFHNGIHFSIENLSLRSLNSIVCIDIRRTRIQARRQTEAHSTINSSIRKVRYKKKKKNKSSELKSLNKRIKFNLRTDHLFNWRQNSCWLSSFSFFFFFIFLWWHLIWHPKIHRTQRQYSIRHEWNNSRAQRHITTATTTTTMALKWNRESRQT